MSRDKLRVKWADFKLSPMKYLGSSEEIRVDRGDGSYFKVKYFSPYVEDKAVKIEHSGDKQGGHSPREHRCHICGSIRRVVWVVPFDAKYSPGWYCYKCRKSRDILDVKRAKKYEKVV